jgi:alkylhydroperoxidase family enzyme
LFTEAERTALAYADVITRTDHDVSDALFARLHCFWDDDAIVELTAMIAWENANSKFHRALRIPAQGLWQRAKSAGRRPAQAHRLFKRQVGW